MGNVASCVLAPKCRRKTGTVNWCEAFIYGSGIDDELIGGQPGHGNTFVSKTSDVPLSQIMAVGGVGPSSARVPPSSAVVPNGYVTWTTDMVEGALQRCLVDINASYEARLRNVRIAINAAESAAGASPIDLRDLVEQYEKSAHLNREREKVERLIRMVNDLFGKASAANISRDYRVRDVYYSNAFRACEEAVTSAPRLYSASFMPVLQAWWRWSEEVPDIEVEARVLSMPIRLVGDAGDENPIAPEEAQKVNAAARALY